ncbi:MAG: hypothetical protein U9N34_04970, partial [Candidatus Cloacimonadota bacterium]|nr:hypothetical protein [Candidatus Cloacimonadota bacterium]
MKIFTTIIISVLFTTIFGLEQIGPNGVKGKFLSTDETTDYIYVTTYNNVLYKVDREDNSWIGLQLNLQAEEVIYSLDSFNDIIFVGTNNHLYKSIDGGQNWNTSDIGLFNLPGVKVSSIHIYKREAEIIFVQMGINIWYRSNDNGYSWILLPSTIGSKPFSYNPISDFVLIIGSGIMHKSFDKGISWIDQPYLFFENTDFFILSSVVVDDTTYIVSGISYNQLSERIFITHNGGVDWQNITFDFDFNLPSDLIKIQDNIYLNSAHSESENTDFGVFKLDIQNENWVHLGDSFAKENTGMYIDSLQDDIIFLSLYGGIFIFDTINNNTQNFTPDNIFELDSRFCSNNNILSDQFFSKSAFLFSLNSANQEWARIDSVYNIFEMSQSTFDENFLIALSIRRGIYISNNYGQTWIQANQGIEENDRQLINNVHFLSENIILVSGYEKMIHSLNTKSFIYRSDNQGQSWNKILEADTNLGDLSISLEDVVEVDGIHYACSIDQGILMTQDLGLTWETVFFLSNRKYYQMQYDEQFEFFYIRTSNLNYQNSKDEIIRTQNFIEWVDCANSISTEYRFIDFALNPFQPNQIFISPFDRLNYNSISPHILVSTDYGNNWDEVTFQQFSSSKQILDFSFFENSNEMAICPQYSSIYKLDISEVSINNQDTEKPIVKISNYPNPFNPTTTIEYNLI